MISDFFGGVGGKYFNPPKLTLGKKTKPCESQIWVRDHKNLVCVDELTKLCNTIGKYPKFDQTKFF